jgi:serine/threonine protein kinase/HAMP domain-containing protein
MDDPDATVIRPQRAPADPEATVVRPRRARAAPPAAADPDATVIKPLVIAPLPPRPTLPLPKAPPLALPAGFRLHEYRIDGVLGQGGFGITYLATDVNLNARVAIKEYLPEEIAFRSSDRSVSPNASRHQDRYRAGLDSFLVEARTLASFRHPAIVRVARFFEAHHTAYMVLEYERGSPLKTWWPTHTAGGEKALVELFLPLFDGLAVVHAAGFLHRDIKPDNIQVRADDGRLVLLDFGSAGQAVAVADQAAVVVTPGYAPPEQYGLGGQGPWTDLYALGATLYWAVTGKKPPDAETRSADPAAFTPAVVAASGQGRFGEAFLKAIDWALDMDPARRPRDIADFRRALFADHLSSLGLLDALKSGDTVIDEEHRTPLQRWRGRVHDALRRVLSPAAWPLALKMTLAMLATALLPMALTAAYNLRASQAAVSAGELRFVEQMAHSTAGRIAQFVRDSQHLARSLGTDHSFAAFLARPDETGRLETTGRLTRLVQANPDVQLIMVMDAAGRAVVSSDPEVVGRNFAFRRYFQEAAQGRPFMTGLVVGAVAGASGMFYAEPVAGDDGRVLGAVVLRIRGSSVATILDEVSTDSTLTPFLIDGDGVLIHHPRENLLYRSLMPLSPAQLAAIRADQRFRRDRIDSLNQPVLAAAMVGAKTTGHVSYFSHLTNQAEIAGFSPVDGHDWVVGVSETRARFEAPLDTLYRQLLWSVLLVGLLFAGLALRFARGIVRPIQALTQSANALKAGDFDQATVSVKRRDEIGQLARTFNVMIDVLRQRERERDRRP